MLDNHQHWPRFIAFVDMNAFFASIEQLDNPEYRGKPIGVTNGKTGTCLITCSYEARALGIYTTMRLKQARALCPGFIQVPARPERYAAVSTGIMHALLDITPDVEVFSVDEAFLDITRCQAYWNKSPRSDGEDDQGAGMGCVQIALLGGAERGQDHGQVRGQAAQAGRPHHHSPLGGP